MRTQQLSKEAIVDGNLENERVGEPAEACVRAKVDTLSGAVKVAAMRGGRDFLMALSLTARLWQLGVGEVNKSCALARVAQLPTLWSSQVQTRAAKTSIVAHEKESNE